MTVSEAVKASGTPALLQKKAIAAAQGMLQPNESVLFAMTGNVSAQSGRELGSSAGNMDNVVLVVTDQRIFTVMRLMTIRRDTLLPLWELRSVEQTRHGLLCRLRLTGITCQLLVEGKEKTIRLLHDAVDRARARIPYPEGFRPEAGGSPL